MPHPLQRGTVVMRDGRFDVVWDVREEELALFPIIRPRKNLAIDVALLPHELEACGVSVAGGAVRPQLKRAKRTGYAIVGALSGPALCRVVAGSIRAFADDANHAKWLAEAKQLRHLDDDRCVNLVR